MIKEVKDLKLVEDILKVYFKNYQIGDPYEKVAIYIDEEIKAIISYSIIYERAEINYIVTIPKYRRQGMSQKLLSYALEDMIKQGCNSVSLEVNSTNDAAIKLYLKNGFEKQAIRKNYYDNDDAFLMTKELVVI